MSQLSSGIVCSGTNSLVPLLSLPPPSSISSSSSASLSFSRFIKGKALVLDYWAVNKNCYKRRRGQHVIQASSEFASQSIWDDWKPPKASSTPSFSEILWPSAGAFVAMAMLGKLDQLLAPKGLSITTAPLGAVSALLFATPNAPSARKYSIFMSQIGCAVIGVLALTIFGPGLLAKSASVAALRCLHDLHRHGSSPSRSHAIDFH
uniref:HPP transmembrane region domain-containing protein n=1 Tax=Lotus japonicus TaxID=34305 RepID=I3SPJ9_LOTJA|nr:unknown [Lotus japonicus]